MSKMAAGAPPSPPPSYATYEDGAGINPAMEFAVSVPDDGVMEEPARTRWEQAVHAVKKAIYYPKVWLIFAVIVVNMFILIPLLVMVLQCDANTEYIPGTPMVPTHDDVIKSVDEIVNSVMGCRDIVGMNLAVIQDTHVLMSKGYGYNNLETKSSVTNQTLFSIASLTKAFTTTLLAQVLRENGLTWDTRVRDILGEDFYFYNGLLTNQSSIQDLAAHTMGIPGHNFARFQGLSRQELAQKIRFFEPTKAHRTSFLYNNLMYGLLALVTETLTGQLWEDLLKERLFEPLGMSRTTFINQMDLSRSDIATPYLPYNGNMRQVSLELHKAWGELGGSGSVMSTSEDMAHWIKLHLNGGRQEDGSRLIAGTVIDNTHSGIYVIPQSKSTLMYKQPQIPVTYDHGKYGLGWRDGYYRGLRMVLHTGTSWGYGAMLTLLPDMRIGIYSSVTGPDDGYYGRRLTHMFIMDQLLGFTPWLNKTTVCTFPEPWEDAVAYSKNSHDKSTADGRPAFAGGNKTQLDGNQNSLPVAQDSAHISPEDYTGTYGNFGYGNITVTNVKSDLKIQYGDLGEWMLQPVTDWEFLGVGQDLVWSVNISKILFEFDSRSTVQRVVFPLETKDPPVFVRDLKMADAPPPPDPGNCGTDSVPVTPTIPSTSSASRTVDCKAIFNTVILISLMHYITRN